MVEKHFASQEKEARSRVIEKKPPMAAINLGTDVDAPRGENHGEYGNFKKILISDHAAGVPNRQLRGDVKIEVQPKASCVRHHLGGCGGDLRTMT